MQPVKVALIVIITAAHVVGGLVRVDQQKLVFVNGIGDTPLYFKYRIPSGDHA